MHSIEEPESKVPVLSLQQIHQVLYQKIYKLANSTDKTENLARLLYKNT